MVKDTTQFTKFRSERSNELVIACCVEKHFISAVLYDVGLSRRYARAVRFGITLSHDDVVDSVNELILRLMRESGVRGNCVHSIGFAAQGGFAIMLEEGFDPGELFLPPDIEVVFLPVMSLTMGSAPTAVLASAMKEQGSVLAVSFGHGLRAASCTESGVKFGYIPMKGGIDGSALETGMPLEIGAIDQMSREPDGTICYSVIGDGDGIGVSAPAAVQAVRIMLDTGALDRDGIMTDRDLFYIGEDHYISQQDVRAVQSDKAACRAALERLGNLTGYHERVIISGEAFGSEQGAAAMAQLGAVPRGLGERYGWSRNPAEQGLIMCLTDPELLRRLTELCDSAVDISAMIHDGFDDLYIKNLAF